MRALKWGVIGAGAIAARRMIPGLVAAGHELVATCRRDVEAGRELADRWGGVAYRDPLELLADPAVEAVYIASPPSLHEEHAVAAAIAEKHVLLEKPTGLSRAEAERIAGAAARGGIALASALMMRHHPAHAHMRAVVAEGALGEIRLVRADFCFLHQEEGWRLDPAVSGGGAFADLGPHLLDLVAWTTGSRPRVAGAVSSPARGADRATTALLELAGGAQGIVTASFELPEPFAPSRFEICGTRGSLVAHGTIGQEATGALEVSGEVAAPGEWADEDLYAAQAAAFAELVDAPDRWSAEREELVARQGLLDDVHHARSGDAAIRP